MAAEIGIVEGEKSSIARQRRGKHVSTTKIQHATTKLYALRVDVI
jgi:hypothetical protein